jgi:arylsulfatase A-like enzyme
MAFYDERIRESDDKIGMILRELDALGLTRHTLVVLAADHGEEFFEHRGCNHGLTFYDEVLHIPLLLRHPALVPPGTRVAQQVRMIDVAPTILAAVGVPTPAAFVGRSVLPLTWGGGSDRPALGGFLPNSERAVVVRHHGIKYVWSPSGRALRQTRPGDKEELYDLRADPGERHNLAPTGHPRLALFRHKAERWVARLRPAARSEQVHFDAKTVERLRALGYLRDQPASTVAPR